MTGALPSLRGVEAFVCVAEVQSLRLAAERLNISQSAVSHRIHALESELGFALFHRETAGLRLTESGENYRAQIVPGLELLRQATDTARHDRPKSSLQIAAPPIIYDQWLMPRLASFLQQNPDTDLQLRTVGTKRAAGSDITIGPLTTAAARAGAIPFFELVVSPVCTEKYFIQFGLNEVKNLSNATLIELAGVSEGWKDWLSGVGMELESDRRIISLDSQAMVCHAACAGLGVGLGVKYLIDDSISSGALVRPFSFEKTLPTTMGIAAPNLDKNPLARKFHSWIIKEMETTLSKDQASSDK